MTVPEGSRIRIEMDGDYQKIIAPYKNARVEHLFTRAFLIVWLIGWFFGWIIGFVLLFSGRENATDKEFISLWLTFWTVAGYFAFSMLRRSFKPCLPEEYILKFPNLIYDSGYSPLTFSSDSKSLMEWWKKSFDTRGQVDLLKRIFHKRTKKEFSRNEIKTLRLEEFEFQNRLIINQRAKRIELGLALSKIESEWLFKVLSTKYQVKSIS